MPYLMVSVAQWVCVFVRFVALCCAATHDPEVVSLSPEKVDSVYISLIKGNEYHLIGG